MKAELLPEGSRPRKGDRGELVTSIFWIGPGLVGRTKRLRAKQNGWIMHGHTPCAGLMKERRWCEMFPESRNMI